MQIQLKIGEKRHSVDLSKGIDLSTTFGLGSEEPKAFYSDSVKIEPVKIGDWVGAVQQGGSVNFNTVFLNPHGNGTHTECVGHISPKKYIINQNLPDFHCLAQYVKLELENIKGDNIITLNTLKKKNLNFDFEAILIEAPISFPQDFSGSNPPYFQPELMAFLRENGVKHFLTNLPSVDREEDGGELAAHKAFWNYPKTIDLNRTITEMVYFKQELKEGRYLLNLQVAPLHNDAAPSRPVLFPLN